MSNRNKLQKFEELRSFPNYYQHEVTGEPLLTTANGHRLAMKGQWSQLHFNNSQPITLELACGRGEYAVALAARYPDTNFIGVDIKGARIWQGARRAMEAGLTNIAFLRTRIEMINLFFVAQEVSEIWITFPDPFLRPSKADRRLTSLPFLARYRELLKPGGLIHLKTDDQQLYEFTLEVVAETTDARLLYHNDDIYAGVLPFEELSTRTYYENMHLQAGKTIKYIRFSLG
jgi:tRNA (guanine-N7-)-methyltransferase